jgi:hypothetical protein
MFKDLFPRGGDFVLSCLLIEKILVGDDPDRKSCGNSAKNGSDPRIVCRFSA